MKNISFSFKHLVLLVVFIQSSWFIYEYRNKDRYYSISTFTVLDKKNGKVLGLYNGKWHVVDLENKEYKKFKFE